MLSFRFFIEHLNVLSTQGHLGIPRREMPQIARDDIAEFIEGLRHEGVAVAMQFVPVKFLLPTQSEINNEKVRLKIEKFQTGTTPKPFLVSNDFHILDGHHQLAALKELNAEMVVECYVVDLPIVDLLSHAHNFHGVFYKDIDEMKQFKQFVEVADGSAAKRAKERAKQQRIALDAQQRQDLELARQDDFRRREQERADKERRQEAERRTKESMKDK